MNDLRSWCNIPSANCCGIGAVPENTLLPRKRLGIGPENQNAAVALGASLPEFSRREADMRREAAHTATLLRGQGALIFPAHGRSEPRWRTALVRGCVRHPRHEQAGIAHVSPRAIAALIAPRPVPPLPTACSRRAGTQPGGDRKGWIADLRRRGVLCAHNERRGQGLRSKVGFQGGRGVAGLCGRANPPLSFIQRAWMGHA
jgi:hypothetical protein